MQELDGGLHQEVSIWTGRRPHLVRHVEGDPRSVLLAEHEGPGAAVGLDPDRDLVEVNAVHDEEVVSCALVDSRTGQGVDVVLGASLGS